jgi:hypothetical protein
VLKWILRISGAVAGVVGVIYLVGWMLPREHVASAEAAVMAPPDRVAALVRDVEGQPRWRSAVKRVEVLERGPAGLRYREHGGDDVITFLFREEAAGRFRSTIVDDRLPFGGAWTIEVRPAPGGSLVRVREDGVVKDPLYRFFSRFVFGHTATMRAYLADLERAAERTPSPAA